jgi:hypothetical protein
MGSKWPGTTPGRDAPPVFGMDGYPDDGDNPRHGADRGGWRSRRGPRPSLSIGAR